jgi:membrane-associated phospholipid phosphatase
VNRDAGSTAADRAADLVSHPERWYWAIVTALVVIGIVALGGVADLAWGIVVGSPLRYADMTFARTFLQTRTALGEAFFAAYTHLGDTVVAAVVTCAAGWWLWKRGLRADAIAVFGATLTAALFNMALKAIVLRTRPPAMFAAVPVPHSPSFPSGHAVVGIVLFGMLAVVWVVEFGLGWRGLGTAAVLATAGVLIGFSRLYLGVHWATDVLGGWLLGTAWVALWTAGRLVLARRRDRVFAKAAPEGRSGRRS